MSHRITVNVGSHWVEVGEVEVEIENLDTILENVSDEALYSEICHRLGEIDELREALMYGTPEKALKLARSIVDTLTGKVTV
jgi:hypothetical protein